LEEFGLPVPRRNAETWRHFDVARMVEQDYFDSTKGNGEEIELSEDEIASFQKKLEKEGGWLGDHSCQARLIYINGRFSPQLSKTNDFVNNIGSTDGISDETKSFLSRLTDGFTDKLAAAVPVGDSVVWDSFKKLSGPDHSIGEPSSQFAINTQQGSACFAALNTRRTGAVAYINVPKEHDQGIENPKPILVVNAVTRNGGASSESTGVSFHPRCLITSQKNSTLSLVQSCVDLDSEDVDVPTLYNGYTQIFVEEGARVAHSFVEESGGIATPGVEMSDDMVEEGCEKPRDIEASRPALKDTHLDAIDVHVMGEDATYEGTMMSIGGSGRVRIAHSVSLLSTGSHAAVNGFCLSGGAQRTDMKTNIHHIAKGTTSEQLQKNMIGGRATGAFRGRIRVEQSAQQTDSQQLSRTVLLSDKSRAWSVPSLEIIADDVQCTHGATVADLSEEELFYLRSRGLTTQLARNLLMYGFVEDVCSCVEPSMLEAVGSKKGLQKRVIEKLENLVPQGERAIRGEFQSI
jgi:Fe-S cluster assembly scaffold protein SufB